MEQIGFIGIGAMGWHMATNLVRAGHRVTVHDADRGRQERFVRERDGRAADTLAALGAEADVVISMLPTGPVVRQVLLQEEGGALANSLRPGTVVVDMSSSEPTGTRELAAQLKERGITLIDAPVSGRVQGAEAGQLVLMIGTDDPDALERVRPILNVLGKKQFLVGGSGAGHAMKALNNFMAGTGFIAAIEALVIGRQFGLDPEVMIDVINEFDRPQLPHRQRDEAGCDQPDVRHEIPARLAGQGRQDCRRSGGGPQGACAALRIEPRSLRACARRRRRRRGPFRGGEILGEAERCHDRPHVVINSRPSGYEWRSALRAIARKPARPQRWRSSRQEDNGGLERPTASHLACPLSVSVETSLS